MALRNPNQKFEQLKQVAANARLTFDCEGWLNLSFYLDEQYVQWNESTRTIQRIPRDPATPKAPRPTFNKIMHFVQQERAMVLQAKPTVDIMPATDDHMDIVEAQVAKAYCDWIAEPINANFDKQLSRAALWALVAFDGYLKWCWNPREKRADIVACSPFEIYPDPYARDFQKARYVIHSQFMDREQVYEHYGREVKTGETVDPMKAELLRGMGSTPVVDGVTVNELWYKPCKRYPQGLYTVWTGNEQLVAPMPHPYEHKRLPFTQIGCIERPDSQHYMAPVRFLRSPQMYFNRYMAQRLLNREAFANSKWWVPEELQLEQDPHDGPRQILRGHGSNGLKPEIIVPPSMPDSGDGAMIEEQMMHLVGLHEVSNAQVPGRVEAAKAIEILKESDADRQQTTLDTIRTAISEGFYQVLMLAKQYAPAEEMVAIYTSEGMPEVKRFKASKLKPGVRVRVTMGTGLARSRAARQDQLMNMWTNGIITNPAQMAELMEISHPSFAAPGMQDQRLARNENLEMAKDIAVQANSYDDHAIHVREHNEFRKTAEFRALSLEIRTKFEFHVDQHEKLWDAQLAKDAQRMALSQPVAPAPGGGGGGGKSPGQPATSPPAEGTVET